MPKARGVSNLKLANTQQAKAIYNYKNTKEKLYRTNAAICGVLYLCSQVLIDSLMMVLLCRNMCELVPLTMFHDLCCILLSAFVG